MKPTLILILSLAMLLAACAPVISVAPTATPADDALATQVSAVLTAMPTATVSTATLAPAQPTAGTVDQPTQPPPTATATLEVTQPPVATPTDTPEAVPTATLPPQPTATMPAGDPAATLGDPDWQDSFTTDRNFPMGEDQFTSAEVNDGYLKLTGLSSIAGWRLSYPEIDDFYLEAAIRTPACTGADNYGLILRVPEIEKAAEGYLFGISCEGKYSLRQWDGEEMTSLVTWKSSQAILSGANQTNRIGVMAEGDTIKLYANGVLLEEVNDDSYDSGGFGLYVQAAKTHNFTIWVERIAYWDR